MLLVAFLQNTEYREVAVMYNVARNNFYENEKNSTIYTPKPVSDFLFSILHPQLQGGVIIDPCVGSGSLLQPFISNGYKTVGIDIEEQGFPNTVKKNFLDVKKGEHPKPDLIIANPPFNIDEKTKELAKSILGARPLLPEVWLEKIISLWGCDVPICLFAPYGLRLNQTITSKRWRKFTTGCYPEISSIVSLPKDIYSDVLFHSEVLIFNLPKLKGHYFYNG